MFGRKSVCFSILMLALWMGVFCTNCRSDKGKHIPDVAHITAMPEWIDARSVLFEGDEPVSKRIDELAKTNPDFYQLYVDRILQLESDSGAFSSAAKENLALFIADDRIQWLNDTIADIFADWPALRQDIDASFKYFQYYFPEKDLPRFYTLISEFGYFPFIFRDSDRRDGLGISLDMFLGENFPYREKLGNAPVFSNYLTRTYNKDHLLMRIYEVLLDDMSGQRMGNRLLDYIIHQGKMKYVASMLMPSTADSILMALPGEKMQWLQANERNIWAHFIQNDLLYETEFMQINKLVNPSPNATGMPPEAPGNVGTWMGWKIVDQYMQRHPDMSLAGLLNQTDGQMILDKSRYKPPRE